MSSSTVKTGQGLRVTHRISGTGGLEYWANVRKPIELTETVFINAHEVREYLSMSVGRRVRLSWERKAYDKTRISEFTRSIDQTTVTSGPRVSSACCQETLAALERAAKHPVNGKPRILKSLANQGNVRVVRQTGAGVARHAEAG